MKTSTITRLLGLAIASAGTLAVAMPSHSATIGTLNGSLANADAIASVVFDTPSPTTSINFKTTSFSTGNFSPLLTLFTGSGTFINEFTAVGDLNFNQTLAPGNYRAVISAFGNFSLGNFSAGFSGGGDFGSVNNVGPARAGSAYALTISTPAVPEPFTIVGTMIGAATALRMRKRLKATNKL